MCFQKEHDLVEEYSYHHIGEKLGFSDNVSTNFLLVMFPWKVAILVLMET